MTCQVVISAFEFVKARHNGDLLHLLRSKGVPMKGFLKPHLNTEEYTFCISYSHEKEATIYSWREKDNH